MVPAPAFLALVVLSSLGPASLMADEENRPALFLPEERQIIREFFHAHPSGLPPGLADERSAQPAPGF